MKGVVFSEFLELVEEKFSADMVDQIIEESDLPSGGAYTTLGTYDHVEMIRLVTKLSEETKITVPELLRTFGIHLFSRFALNYPQFFLGIENAFQFLENLEDYIHVEVRKLYADVELPTFAYETPTPGCLVMTYRSGRPFGDLAEGLIRGCIEHFGESINLDRENISEQPKTCVRFTLTKDDGSDG